MVLCKSSEIGYEPKRQTNVTKPATFFHTRVILVNLGDNSKVVLRRIEKLSKTGAILNAELKLFMCENMSVVSCILVRMQTLHTNKNITKKSKHL